MEELVQDCQYMEDMHSMAFGIESYMHDVLKNLKKYKLGNYLFEYIKLNDSIIQSVSELVEQSYPLFIERTAKRLY